MMSPSLLDRWEKWIEVTHSRCHLHFAIDGGTIEKHAEIGLSVGNNNAKRVMDDVGRDAKSILEVGCSVGFNCMGLATQLPDAQVVGIEPDAEAVDVAIGMAKDLKLKNTKFLVGFGEEMPFPDNSFDLVVCHTVIEHVKDVDATISEIARVLRPGGKLHLEAPNYIWPEEPHLQIIVPPLCPKPLMRLLANLQGKGRDSHYAEHLQLVYPGWIERNFKTNGFTWTNRAEAKLKKAVSGDHASIVAYKRSAKIMSVLRSIGLANFAVVLLLTLRLYPSILYTAVKEKKNSQ